MSDQIIRALRWRATQLEAEAAQMDAHSTGEQIIPGGPALGEYIGYPRTAGLLRLISAEFAALADAAEHSLEVPEGKT